MWNRKKRTSVPDSADAHDVAAIPGLSLPSDETNGNDHSNSNGGKPENNNQSNNLGLGLIGAQTNAGQLPGKFGSTMNGIEQISRIGKNLAGTIYPWE